MSVSDCLLTSKSVPTSFFHPIIVSLTKGKLIPLGLVGLMSLFRTSAVPYKNSITH